MNLQLKSISLIILFLVMGTTAITYDPEISQKLQRYSIICHCTQAEITDWSCKACKSLPQLESFVYIENKLAQTMCYMGYSKEFNAILLIFRGTIDLTNWIQDFSYNQINYSKCKNCKIHEGFYFSYLTISLQINAALEGLQSKYGKKQVIVVGASLGGALAAVAALQIQLKYESVRQLHTFGCPRLGNQDFASFLKSKIPNALRVVHNRDIVPHLPLQSQNYYQFPTEVLFDEEMKTYKICNGDGQDPSCSDSFYPYFNPEDHVTYWTKLSVHDICS